MARTLTMPQRPVVVVTGASAGVGRAVVRRFARDGARIGLIARGRVGLEGAARDVEQLGGEALILPTDVSDPEAVESAARLIEEALGPIDIWVNAAFAGVLAPFMDMTPEDYRRVTDVTYHGQVNGTRAALRRMLPRGRGAIVLVGSALAYRGIPLQSAYCGAKHAIQGFQDALEAELAHMGSAIHVAMVQLPGVNTPQFDWIRTTMPRRPKPASPPFQPEVAANAIHYAALHRRKSMWVAFSSAKAILGDRLASPWLDRYLGATAIEGQQDEEPVSPDRKDNLWHPVEEDRGAHGRFDDTARRRSIWLEASVRPGLTALATAAALAAGASLLWRGRKG